jgi:hypothetical protein
MSILFFMIAPVLLAATALFIYSVIRAPDGTESTNGFVLESGLAGQFMPESMNRLKSGHDGIAGMSAVTTTGS